MTTNRNGLIALLGAGIGGGFGDTLRVFYDREANQISLEVTTSCPRGGMDGDPTPFYRVTEQVALPGDCKAKVLLDAVKRIIAKDQEHLFKSYGKPTRRMEWASDAPGGWAFGLSIKLVQDALGKVRGKQ